MTFMAACRGRPCQLDPLFRCRLQGRVPGRHAAGAAAPLWQAAANTGLHCAGPLPNGLEPAQLTLWRCWTVCTLADTAEWSTTYLAMLLVSAQQAGLCGEQIVDVGPASFSINVAGCQSCDSSLTDNVRHASCTCVQRHGIAEYRPHKHELHCTAPTPNGIALPARSDNAQTPGTRCWTPSAAAAAVARSLKITNSI